MRRVRRMLGIIFFGVLIRDLIRASLLILLGVVLAQRLPNIFHLLLVSLSILSASIFANIENDIADIELDRKVKAYRPLPSGKYTSVEARMASIIFLIACIVLGAVASAASKNLTLLLVLLMVPTATYLYSSPPVRLKSRSWLGVGTLSLIYFSPLVTGYILAKGEIQNLPLLFLLLLVFFLATGVKDFEDVDVDRSFGVITPPVRYGVGKTAASLRWASIVSIAFAATLCTVYLARGLLPHALYCLAVAPSVLAYLRRLSSYASSGQTTDLMRLVKGCLWAMYVWPVTAGIIIFLSSAALT